MFEINWSKVPERLRQERCKSGLKIKEIADYFHVVEGTVKKWMNGETHPSTETLLGLSKLFGCSIENLLTGEKEEKGIDYIVRETGLSLPSIQILRNKKNNMGNAATFDELLTKRGNLISEIHRIIFLSYDYRCFKESMKPEDTESFAEEKIIDLWASLRVGLSDKELKDEIALVYAPAFYKKTSNKEDDTVYLRPALFRDIKAVYLKYCDVEKQLQKIKDEIRFQDPFLDTLDRIINSEQLIEDISKYLNKPILWTFRIDDGDPSGERMNFDNENIHGRYDSDSGAIWLEIHDGQSHTVRINKDFVIDADFIRKMFIDRIRDDLDAMID